MHRIHRAVAGTATSVLVAGAVAALGPSAWADPVNRMTSTATVGCADGSTYEVTAPDRSAQFAVAHDLGSNAVLIPLAWGTAHIELHSLVDGALIDSFDEGWGGVKGSSQAQPGAKACTVSISGPEDIPELGTVLVTVDIPVTLVVTPR